VTVSSSNTYNAIFQFLFFTFSYFSLLSYRLPPGPPPMELVIVDEAVALAVLEPIAIV
jgi:hypothetical protein